ncbi:hypothetical protein D9758_012613 [Tetrapyrgos nigripes]|uniref:Protein kinase domain-containing protein n=1 Tax=Tetrapyrgos nigripes TaxID=182062 RepID=A0A8H5GDP6_9AGAR|nr:hypothetical protein D9758_012613 [Tetrapyrgos nigripes]
MGDNPLDRFAVKKIAVRQSHMYLLQTLREVKLLEKLHHPNIVAYHHSWLEPTQFSPFGSCVPTLLVLMQWAEGGSLDDFIEGRLQGRRGVEGGLRGGGVMRGGGRGYKGRGTKGKGLNGNGNEARRRVLGLELKRRQPSGGRGRGGETKAEEAEGVGDGDGDGDGDTGRDRS